MSRRTYSGIFIAEGTSDLPISNLVEELFFDRGFTVQLSKPDFGRLTGVRKDVQSRITAGKQLMDQPIDLIVVHRDADNAGPEARRDEIFSAAKSAGVIASTVPVIPIRMTEAWLLLDETAIRTVAGKPRGRMPLNLPKIHEVESHVDPKKFLAECFLKAAEETGRRRERVAKRFGQNRRQLLERLSRNGPVSQLSSWQQLVVDVDTVVAAWRSRAE